MEKVSRGAAEDDVGNVDLTGPCRIALEISLMSALAALEVFLSGMGDEVVDVDVFDDLAEFREDANASKNGPGRCEAYIAAQ